MDATVSNRNIFQTYISDDGELSTELKRCVETVRSRGKQYAHHLFDAPRIRAFLVERHAQAVVDAFDKLVPNAYKADLARYCLLHSFGGWYVDMAVALNLDLPLARDIDHVIFRDAFFSGRQPWHAATSFLFAAAGSPIMKAAIDAVVENCAAEHYGANELDPTGPGVFGRAIAAHGSDERSIHGAYMSLTPQHPQKNYAFVLPRGEIVAWGKKTAGAPQGQGLAGLGVKGVNDYTALYHAKQIYRRAEGG